MIQALQLLGSLSILIVLHELGHFLAAKYFKVRVEKFYLFFDFLFPMPDVMKFSLFKKKIGDTEYGIGWFPMGGYVQMSGIMDETMDKDALAKPAEPYEFRAKPAWQRLIILLGGIIVNVLLAFVIYTGMAYTWGDKYLPTENAIYGIAVDSLGTEIGLQNGDLITHVDGVKKENFNDIKSSMIFDLGKNITVKRGSESFVIDGLDDKFYKKVLDTKGAGLYTLAVPAVIYDFPKNSAIENAGAKVGDKLISINGKQINYQSDVSNMKPELINKELTVVLDRNGKQETVTLKTGEKGLLGYQINSLEETFEFGRREYTFGEAIVAGPVKTWETLVNYIKQFKLIFNSEIKGYKQIGGFAAIGSMFPETFSWEVFWKLTAFLSVMLAFLNLLPIPALDGGHAVFTLYEMIVGKPANEKFMEIAQIIGMVILFGLLIFANGNDLVKWIMTKFG
ncbi:MAG: RIP metalloprotease RseP [Chitinophagales bacterium]